MSEDWAEQPTAEVVETPAAVVAPEMVEIKLYNKWNPEDVQVRWSLTNHLNHS